METCIIIDDREDVCRENEGSSIKIPAFNPNVLELDNFFRDYEQDDYLLQLKNWIEINDIENCENLKNLNKERIFF